MGDNNSRESYLDNIKLMPVNSGLSLRSKKEILDRLLVDYVIASIATYAFCSSYELIKTFLTTLDSKFEVSKIINGKDKEQIINIFNKKYDKKKLEEITYRFESANTCMWILGLSDDITYKNKCSVKKINELLLGSIKYNDLLSKCNVRSVDEILDYFSDISKIIYSDNNDSSINNIISMQDNLIKYVVLYNFNKNGLKIKYNNDKLHFEFELPNELKFQNVSSDVLFALKGPNNIKVLAQEIDNERIQDNIKKLMKKGFEVLDVSYVRSLYIEKRIIKVNMSRKGLLVNTYYLYLDNHLIRIDFNVSKINIESDIIYTIKIF